MYLLFIQDLANSATSTSAVSDDHITMLLTAVGVAVAAAALMLGIVSFYIAYIAFVGKREIIKKAEAAARKTAKQIAESVAKKAAEDYLENDERLQELDEPAVELEEQAPEGDNGNNELG